MCRICGHRNGWTKQRIYAVMGGVIVDPSRTSHPSRFANLIQESALATDKISMEHIEASPIRNHGRHQYVRRGWIHRWTPVSAQISKSTVAFALGPEIRHRP